MYIIQFLRASSPILSYLPGPWLERKCKKPSGTGTERELTYMSYYFMWKIETMDILSICNGCIINFLPESYHLVNKIVFPITSNTSHFS